MLDQRKASFLRRNSLSIAVFAIFAVLTLGLVLTGHDEFNADEREHGGQTVSLTTYLSEGHFWEAVFENWESEFLQMGAYVALTIFLIQKGSAESKDPDKKEPVDEDPRNADTGATVPWPVRKGGLWLRLYENSLLIAFFALFIGSFVGHAVGGVDSYNAELVEHHQPTVSTWGYVSGSRFWFEAFQNWQSEFLAVALIVVLTIFLRQKGSPESKPVAAAHSDTGSS